MVKSPYPELYRVNDELKDKSALLALQLAI